MGGECQGGVCLPHRVHIDDIEDGRIATLGSDVVVAKKATTADNATLSRLSKAAPHEGSIYNANDTRIQGLATSAVGQVFWAGESTIHRIDSSGIDTVLTPNTGEDKSIDFGGLALATPAGGEQRICFLNANSGVFCQPTTGQNEPVQILQLANPKGLAVDATHLYSVSGPGMPMATIFSSNGGGSMFVRIADNAFALLRHEDNLYWLTSDDNLHRVTIADPEANDIVEAVSGTAKRLLAREDFIYVLTSSGLERFDSTTLQRDTSFTLPLGSVPLDFALDDDGIYWLSGGFQTSELGFYALPVAMP